jgi:hypothetical protein
MRVSAHILQAMKGKTYWIKYLIFNIFAEYLGIIIYAVYLSYIGIAYYRELRIIHMHALASSGIKYVS